MSMGMLNIPAYRHNSKDYHQSTVIGSGNQEVEPMSTEEGWIFRRAFEGRQMAPYQGRHFYQPVH